MNGKLSSKELEVATLGQFWNCELVWNKFQKIIWILVKEFRSFIQAITAETLGLTNTKDPFFHVWVNLYSSTTHKTYKYHEVHLRRNAMENISFISHFTLTYQLMLDKISFFKPADTVTMQLFFSYTLKQLSCSGGIEAETKMPKSRKNTRKNLNINSKPFTVLVMYKYQNNSASFQNMVACDYNIMLVEDCTVFWIHCDYTVLS
ncbi:Hypothetical predicted protein [Octopus vulgaris]|uniref:Uncharacterized protein n=1 Tax=Octopus vulgaris TaxID=6645 RepID=A0AA36AHY2_OCTVU|nr:Hypothetical predicted protein [Octopus vulgaris]